MSCPWPPDPRPPDGTRRTRHSRREVHKARVRFRVSAPDTIGLACRHARASSTPLARAPVLADCHCVRPEGRRPFPCAERVTARRRSRRRRCEVPDLDVRREAMRLRAPRALAVGAAVAACKGDDDVTTASDAADASVNADASPSDGGPLLLDGSVDAAVSADGEAGSAACSSAQTLCDGGCATRERFAASQYFGGRQTRGPVDGWDCLRAGHAHLGPRLVRQGKTTLSLWSSALETPKLVTTTAYSQVAAASADGLHIAYVADETSGKSVRPTATLYGAHVSTLSAPQKLVTDVDVDRSDTDGSLALRFTGTGAGAHLVATYTRPGVVTKTVPFPAPTDIVLALSDRRLDVHRVLGARSCRRGCGSDRGAGRLGPLLRAGRELRASQHPAASRKLGARTPLHRDTRRRHRRAAVRFQPDRSVRPLRDGARSPRAIVDQHGYVGQAVDVVGRDRSDGLSPDQK